MLHGCKNLLLRCMDFRLEPYFEKWLAQKGYVGDCDIISIAGSCKELAADPEGCFGATIFSQIDLGYKGHGVRRILLTMHRDCGAYGGETAFTNQEAETLKLKTDMAKVKEILHDKYSDVEVLMFFVSKSGDDWEIIEVNEEN